MQKIYLLTVLAPLIGALVAGFGGRFVGRTGAHTVTILGVLIVDDLRPSWCFPTC